MAYDAQITAVLHNKYGKPLRLYRRRSARQYTGHGWETSSEMVGIHDSFGESGQPDELMENYGLVASDIVRAAKQAIERKHLAC